MLMIVFEKVFHVHSTIDVIYTAEQKEHEIVGKWIVCHQLIIEEFDSFNAASGICRKYGRLISIGISVGIFIDGFVYLV